MKMNELDGFVSLLYKRRKFAAEIDTIHARIPSTLHIFTALARLIPSQRTRLH